MARQKVNRQLRDGTLTKTHLLPDVFLIEGPRINPADSPYAPLEDDRILRVDTTLGSVEVLLPPVVGIEGRSLLIKDVGGNLSVLRTLTVTPDGVETIDGVGGSKLLTAPFSLLEIIAAPLGWFVLKGT